MAKGKDSVIIYESFLDATEDLEAVAIAEIWRAIRAFMKGEEQTFTDMSAKLAWKFIKLQLEADADKWRKTCEARVSAGRNGGIKSGQSRGVAKQNEANEANASFASNCEAKRSKTKQNEANEADTDTDTDTDIKKKYIKKEKAVASDAGEETKVWTLDDFRDAAKDPSVALPEKDVAECFDFYAAQGFRRSNGQPIVSVAPLLRLWKRKLGEFAGSPKQPTNQQRTQHAIISANQSNRNAGTYNEDSDYSKFDE